MKKPLESLSIAHMPLKTAAPSRVFRESGVERVHIPEFRRGLNTRQSYPLIALPLWMDGWMDGRMDGWMDGWMKWMDGRVDVWMYVWMYGCMCLCSKE